jgi:hypothetical protein
MQGLLLVAVGSKEFREIGCDDVGWTWLALAFAVFAVMVDGGQFVSLTVSQIQH